MLCWQHRYDAIIGEYNASAWKLWTEVFNKSAALRDTMFGLADVRGKETDELQREVNGLAAASGLPLKFIQVMEVEQSL